MREPRQPVLGRLVLASSVLAALAVLLLTVLGAAAFPKYSHASQFISELGAVGAPNASLVNFAGFLPAGILVLAFSVLAWLALPRSAGTSLGLLGIALFGLGYLVAAFYPCEPGCRPPQPSTSQLIHNALGLAGYVTAPVFLSLLGWQARKWVNGSALSNLAYVCGVLSLVGLVLLSPEFAYVGVAQRMLEASVLSWILACGVYVSRSHASA